MIRAPKKSGFTIIELMLAMSFVSVLLLAVVTTAINAGRVYNKGLTLQSVNQAGRDVGDTLRRDFLQSNAQSVSQDPTSGGVVISTDRTGRFCLGGYSYLWNTPQVLADGISDGTVISTQTGSTTRPVSFVRVVDRGGSLCQVQGSGGYTNLLTDPDLITHLLKQPSDTSDVTLAIYDFRLAPAVSPSGGAGGLYKISYTIGTSATQEINTASQSCKAPSEVEANDQFCAINNFETIVRTNGQ